MKTTLKKLPPFKSEDEERDFWTTHDATDYFDFSKGQITDVETFHNQPAITSVTIRFSNKQLNLVRKIAKRMDVGYQSLIKVWLDERLLQEKAQRHF
jgi:predicted DNA binding CopG/RHH family protein